MVGIKKIFVLIWIGNLGALPTPELFREYESHSALPSNINEHIPYLRQLAKDCVSATEIGVGDLVSTWGILQGLSEGSGSEYPTYIGIDLKYPSESKFLLAAELADDAGVTFQFLEGNDFEPRIDIKSTELLFIDSWHAYCHLTYELEKFSPKVRKYIAIRGTSGPWENQDEPCYLQDVPPYPTNIINRFRQGLWPAVEDFLATHPEWRLKERLLNNEGLTVLERSEIQNKEKETIFVSLGSYCGPAGYVQKCGLRKAAFPLDWTVSMDGERVIELIDDRFQHFLDDDFLVPDDFLIPFASGTVLVNTYYHIEFVHGGVWRGEEYNKKFDSFKSQFQRRVNRFNKLEEFTGKVYFMRASYIYSLTDQHRIYHFSENLEISREYSLRLHESLKKRFPRLDFCLIIMNASDTLDVVVEEKISNSLMMIRGPVEVDSVTTPAYRKFFNQLFNSP